MDPIFQRVSVRKFQPKPVEQEKVERLLRAAMAAPSAGNQQGWEFIMVTDQALLDELSKVSLPPLPPGETKHPDHVRCPSTLVKDAPLAIVVLGNRRRMRFPEYWEQDLGAATENILLEAVQQDLGAVWLGVAPVPERMGAITRLFDLPEHILPHCIVAVGYPAGEVKSQEDRFHSEYVHYNEFRN